MPICSRRLTGHDGETREGCENAKEVGSCRPLGNNKNHARQRIRHLVADDFEHSEQNVIRNEQLTFVEDLPFTCSSI
jgi:hypothetical protein